MNLLVLCPSRSRPWGALDAYQSFLSTKERHDTSMVFVVDEDDDKLGSYKHLELPLYILPPQGGMVAALNTAALHYADDAQYIGFIGDDHRFRTPGWDAAFTRALDANGGGLAYGNDLFWPQGQIPTQIFMSSSIIRALGWMGLPSCKHLYIDNVWKVLGDSTDSLFYFPRYVIEHLHPAAGKAEWDAQYLRLNSEERYAADRAAFEAWMATQASEDCERVRSALTGPSVAG